MRSLLYISLLGSFIALVHAFEASDFSIFLDDEATLDILPWEDISEENPDLSFLLANECSDFSPPFSRKRARRQNPPNFCRARTGSTAEGGQTGENDHTDDSNKPETRLDDTLTLPFLAPYFDENNNDCLRLSDGELPLAVCDVNNQGSSPDYFINGRPYWDLLYSYPSKKDGLFPPSPIILPHSSSRSA